MNTVERVIALCEEKGITLSRLEKDCGFGNGYIGKKLKSGMLPADRLQAVSDYLNVNYLYLLTGETKKGEYGHDEQLATIIDCYERLNKTGRDLLYTLAYTFVTNEKYLKEKTDSSKVG